MPTKRGKIHTFTCPGQRFCPQPDAMNLFEPLQPPGSLPLGMGHALLPGDMLEDFEITQVLGLTSFGVLYLATHVVEHNTVAIKEYLPSTLATRNAEGQVELRDPAHEESFHRGLQSFAGEALSLSQFNHPNLLHVSCVWEANGTVYRAMPHLVGTSLLAQRSSSKEPASQAQLQALRDGLLEALDTLHGAGLAHGQVEPANIFMLEGERPVLMGFDAVRHAVLSDTRRPHVDAFADPAQVQKMVAEDLHAVAAVLHFAISKQWVKPSPGECGRHEALADVLAGLKDSASALGYAPEFLSAIDTALASAPADRPATMVQFRALFEPAAQGSANRLKPPRAPKRVPPQRPPNEFPLNSSESVLALLANFDRGPVNAPDDIEPFESPAVPTLTEEAEPSLPPLRESLFDAMDAGESPPQSSVSYGRLPFRPMPPVPASRWRRLAPALGFGGLALACVVALGWLLTT